MPAAKTRDASCCPAHSGVQKAIGDLERRQDRMDNCISKIWGALDEKVGWDRMRVLITIALGLLVLIGGWGFATLRGVSSDVVTVRENVAAIKAVIESEK